jgi:hypothetical protein
MPRERRVFRRLLYAAPGWSVGKKASFNDLDIDGLSRSDGHPHHVYMNEVNGGSQVGPESSTVNQK